MSVPAVAYLRYFSHSQNEASIETQLAICQAYAEREGYRIIGIYEDRAKTGRTDARPDFQRMIRDAAKGLFEVVIIYKTDRFARNRYDAAYYKHALSKHGVRIMRAAESIPDGKDGIILESIYDGMAEWYSVNLSENVVDGMTRAAGERHALGVKVYGYDISTGYYQINDVTAPVVENVFHRYVKGETVRGITNSLNAEGLRNIRGNLWIPSTVHTLIRNERYIGTYKWGDIRIENGMPRIISDDLFETANSQVRGKNMGTMHDDRDTYLLTGRIVCGKCGATVAGKGAQSKGRRYQYYSCSKHNKGECDQRQIPRDLLEDFVATTTAAIVTDPEAAEELVDAIMKHQNMATHPC